MKKLIALLLTAVLMLSFTACRSEKPDSISAQSSIESYSEILKDTEINSVIETVTEDVSSVTETVESNEEVSAETTDDTESVLSESPSAPENNNTLSENVSSEESSTESTVEDTPQIEKATAEDAKEIAVLVAKYINENRNKNGVADAVTLVGLCEYAEYRSSQIVTNFSHDTFDERAAATALEYGKYTDPSLFGVEGEPFYSAEASEAIVKTDYLGSKEQVARSIVNLVINSSSHWSYVGHADNKYIGVGITYENGIWYCDIAVSKENYEK